MADFDRSMALLMRAEFSNSLDFLHKNQGEKTYTLGGIYRYAHPEWVGWPIVDHVIENTHTLEEASRTLYGSATIRMMLDSFYREKYWRKMKLDEVGSQKVADELFLFGVNAGTRNAVMKAQKVVGAIQDGLIGPVTISLLNGFDENEFDMKFDEAEKEYYRDIIARRPSLARFEKGWANRAELA